MVQRIQLQLVALSLPCDGNKIHFSICILTLTITGLQRFRKPNASPTLAQDIGLV